MAVLSDLPLVSAFRRIDKSVADALAKAENEGKKLACEANCDACCRQPIPATPLEMFALAEYARHHIHKDIRAQMLRGIGRGAELAPAARPCPFLLKSSCAAYEARPIACRRYLVAGAKCFPGQTPTETRPKDVIEPSRRVLAEVLRGLFGWHAARYQALGLPAPPDHADDRAKLDYIFKITSFLQAADWTKILGSE